MNKAFVSLFLLSALALVACTGGTTGSQAAPAGQQAAPSGGAAPAPGAAGTTNASVPKTVEINMTAQQYSFDPSTITVNEGDTVILHVTSQDVTHGISIPAFGVDVVLPPHEEQTVSFVADKKGTFPFRCSVYCGSGHASMRGEVIVQ